jgi:hypothetical protein
MSTPAPSKEALRRVGDSFVEQPTQARTVPLHVRPA